jgi:hypothetical protein
VVENVPVDAERALEQGRGAYADRAWVDAFAALSRANREQALGPDDLELLAHSAYMRGLDHEYRAAFEQAYHAYHDAGDASRAARGKRLLEVTSRLTMLRQRGRAPAAGP